MSISIHPARPGPLPEQQQKVLDFVKRAVAKSGAFPETEAIREHMGWKSVHSVHDCLNRMAWRGAIWRTGSRKWTLKS